MIAPKVSEREFTAQVIELAQMFGWKAAHFRPAWTGRGWRTPVQGDGAGFPDLILVRGARLIAAELKVDGAKATEPQLEWLRVLATAGATTAVWHPSQFDQIAETLR